MNASRVLTTLLARAEAHGWVGQDPYDGLESLLGSLVKPLGPLPRFAASQVILRSPSLRALASPIQTRNPKALGLFLGAALRGRPVLGESRASELTEHVLHEISQHGTIAGDATGWGYPFGWQSRYFWAPAGTPNAVVTSILTWHLVECADLTTSARALELGCAGARFLATRFTRSRYQDGEAISYTAMDRTQVVNVSALAARALMRASRHPGLENLGDVARSLTRFVVASQRKDGSWPYSTDTHGSWEDSFHTGYVLESLIHLQELGVEVPDRTVVQGFEAYRRFFGSAGEARLRARADSALDAHSAAQGILTYAALARSSRASPEQRDAARGAAQRIADWALRDLWIEQRQHFAYRIQGTKRDEREFTRWVSAWMALALATVACLAADPTPASEPRTEAVGAR